MIALIIVEISVLGRTLFRLTEYSPKLYKLFNWFVLLLCCIFPVNNVQSFPKSFILLIRNEFLWVTDFPTGSKIWDFCILNTLVTISNRKLSYQDQDYQNWEADPQEIISLYLYLRKSFFNLYLLFYIY